MKTSRAFALALLLLVSFAPRAGGQTIPPESATYTLSSATSAFVWGCYDPCACPISIRSPLTGTFVLRMVSVYPIYTHYEVLDVDFQYPRYEGAVGRIRGSGQYRHGGEVALMEQLVLDLSFDGAPVQHFDSGLRSAGAPFPHISTRVSLHSEYCFDSVLVVDAKPFGTVGAPGVPDPGSLIVGPNPFRLSTRIGFVLPGDATLSLSVLDIAGRRVRVLADRERLPAGPHTRTWDGTLDAGGKAPPGLYVVMIEMAAGRVARSLVRLE
jgi:hypothetical protein